jgi:glyoxylase-like metal-dependent hydrolase (beta-lactamase superfamily II)
MSQGPREVEGRGEASGAERLVVRGWPLGPFATNCYLVHVEGAGDAREAWVIDPGFGPGAVVAEAARLGLKVSRVILTHAHGDHIAGVREAMEGLARTVGERARLMIHELEASWLSDPVLNLSEAIGMPVTAPGADELLSDGQRLTLGAFEFQVRHTPGHSPGSVSLWCERAGLVIAGDTLFAGSVGRTDFPGSDHATLVRSIRERLFSLPSATRVLPGHGPETTVGHERLTNPYVRG